MLEVVHMLYNYKEALQLYNTDYNIKKAIKNKEFYKIEAGIYSDKNNNYNIYELLLKKYPNAFLVKDSALHFIGFISEEPSVIHLGTCRNALRIKDKRVNQHFYSGFNKKGYSYKLLNSNHVKSFTTENENEIRLFDLNALLFDLIRERNKYSREALCELLNKFKDCSVFDDFDYGTFEDNLLMENKIDILLNDEIYELLYDIALESSDRRWRREWNFD